MYVRDMVNLCTAIHIHKYRTRLQLETFFLYQIASYLYYMHDVNIHATLNCPKPQGDTLRIYHFYSSEL